MENNKCLKAPTSNVTSAANVKICQQDAIHIWQKSRSDPYIPRRQTARPHPQKTIIIHAYRHKFMYTYIYIYIHIAYTYLYTYIDSHIFHQLKKMCLAHCLVSVLFFFSYCLPAKLIYSLPTWRIFPTDIRCGGRSFWQVHSRNVGDELSQFGGRIRRRDVSFCNTTTCLYKDIIRVI